MKPLQKTIIFSTVACLTFAACGSDRTDSSITAIPSTVDSTLINPTVDTATATSAATTPTIPTPDSTVSATTNSVGASPETKARLTGLLESHFAAGEFVGARIALRDRNGNVTEAAFGNDTIGPNAKPVNLDVPWGIGSVTKVFVAVTVLQLVDEGRIELDASIDTHFPDLPSASEITIRDLLQHTSGLNEYVDRPEVVNGGTRVWLPGELVAIAEARGRFGAPGGDHRYSNTNYILLGEIIEKVTGNSWLEEVTTRIIEPLGMRSTRIVNPVNAAPGHALVDTTFSVKVLRDPSYGGAGGALQSTGRDLLLFADALNAGRLLSGESRKAMESFVPGADYSAFGVTHGYGLGMERYQNESITVLGHLGSSDAWGAFIGFDRASGNAVAVAINSDNAGPQAVMAIEALIGAATP